MKERILLALSGGVDSSTAAVLLLEAGYELVGCTMQLWDSRRNPAEDGQIKTGRCCSLDDTYDARRVAEHLGFPFYVLNLEKEFGRHVIEPFIGQYLAGKTPIPCTSCNTFLKFDSLIQFARGVGVEKVATGHYARVEDWPGEGYVLRKGADEKKDQSYYLFELRQAQLARILFPVGGFQKEEIRELAEKQGLTTARKPDSQEICFVPDGDYVGFIQRNAEAVNKDFLPVLADLERPGPILFKDGTQLGVHTGVHRYTIGQRKGLGIASEKPLYVMKLDVSRNTVVVGRKEDVYSRGLVAERVNWISGRPPSKPIEVKARIRSNHVEAPALLMPEELGRGEWRVKVSFEQPQLAVTPGQASVFYKGDRVLGGGWITEQLN